MFRGDDVTTAAAAAGSFYPTTLQVSWTYIYIALENGFPWYGGDFKDCNIKRITVLHVIILI